MFSGYLCQYNTSNLNVILMSSARSITLSFVAHLISVSVFSAVFKSFLAKEILMLMLQLSFNTVALHVLQEIFCGYESLERALQN